MSKRKWFFVSQCLVACALIIALLISVLGVPWVQAWSSDPTENTAVCTASNNQRYPAIVSDGSGGTIITWEDYRGGTHYDIYAQRVDSSGVPQWTANGVAVCTAFDDQYDPVIVSDGSGGAIITWEDWRTSSPDIYAQRVDSSGVPQWTANGVAVCTASDDQRDPVIVSDGSGGAIIIWEDARSGTVYKIYAQRVDLSGVPQWTANGVAVCISGNAQFDPAVVSDGSGGAIITWRDNRGSTDYDIYAQRVDSSGVPQWSANGVAVCTASRTQGDPAVVSDGSGGAIITWQDQRSGDDIYAQRVDSSGVPQWTANGVAVCTASDDQRNPAVASDGSGGAIITWEDRGGTYVDIYIQRVNQSGVPEWTANGIAICTASGDQWYPAPVSDGSGGAIITWQDQRSGDDIYAQRVNPSGVLQWTANGVAICTASDDQWYPAPVSDGSGGAIICHHHLVG